jgi:hypothetical protein
MFFKFETFLSNWPIIFKIKLKFVTFISNLFKKFDIFPENLAIFSAHFSTKLYRNINSLLSAFGRLGAQF